MVNQTAADKVVDPPMASLVNSPSVIVPPALRAALTTTYLNGQNRYSTESRRSSDAASVGSNRSDAASVSSGSASNVESNQIVYDKKEATDFIFGKIIGEGSFSTVYLAKDIHSKMEYASKLQTF